MEINQKNTPTDDNTASQGGGDNTAGNAQAPGGEAGGIIDGASNPPEDQNGNPGTNPGGEVLDDPKDEKSKGDKTKKDKSAGGVSPEDEKKKEALKQKGKTLENMPGKPGAVRSDKKGETQGLENKPIVHFYNKSTRRKQKLPGKTFAKLYRKTPDNFDILPDPE